MEYVTLGSVARVVRQPLPNSVTGTMTYIATGDADEEGITSRQLIDFSELPNRANLQASPGDLLVARMASTVKVVEIDADNSNYVYSTGFAALRITSPTLSPKYLANWMRTKKFQRAKDQLSAGATQKAILDDYLIKLPVPIAPISDQLSAVEKIESCKKLIAHRADHLALLEELSLSLYDRYRDSAYQTAKLKDLSQIWDCSHSTPKWTNEGPICLRTTNLGKGTWNWADTRHVSESDFEARSKGGGAKPNDIILSREGTVGIAAMVYEGMSLCMGQRLVQVRANSEVVNPRYLLAYLLDVLRPEKISQAMVGSTAQHLNVSDLRNLEVPVLPLKAQSDFGEMATSIDRQKELSLQSLAQLQELLASLYNECFGGE